MNKTTLLMIIISLALFSCMSKDEPEVPLSYMKATVNGIEWKSESYGTDNPYAAIDKGYNEVNLMWALPNWITANNRPSFYLSMYYPIAPGKYTFNNNGVNVPQKGIAVFIQGGANYYSTSGYVYITHSSSLYLEGTFNVTVKNDSNDTIEFKNGAFKAFISLIVA